MKARRMADLDRLIPQIQRNCDISDAHHGGIFSICGLALRLRDLFKWERGLAPWEEGDPAAVLEWIGVREAYWETLAGVRVTHRFRSTAALGGSVRYRSRQRRVWQAHAALLRRGLWARAQAHLFPGGD
ncbi:MAG: hypothetical protein MZV70_73500 [Desulfobacterales bacterium]|nr:hypothetical protein [Desulfobacterales bacterium]